MKASAVFSSYAVIHLILFILSELKSKGPPAARARRVGMKRSSPSAFLCALRGSNTQAVQQLQSSAAVLCVSAPLRFSFFRQFEQFEQIQRQRNRAVVT